MPTEIEERSGLLRQLLVSRRMLIVLDNARAEAQVRPLLPGAGGSLVLVTSRSVLSGLETDGRISLDVLSESDAAAMLTRLIGMARAGAEPEVLAQLAGLCGRLPLALRIAGQLLSSHPVWPVAKVTQLLAGEQDRLGRLGAGDLQVRAAFEVSYLQLAEEDAALFRLLDLHPGPAFSAAVAAALAGIVVNAAEPVLERLAEAYLITEDPPGRFGMHDLLRLFVRSKCQAMDNDADRDAAEGRLVNYYVHLAGFLDSCVDPELRPAAEQKAEQAGVPLPSMREALAVFQTEQRSLMAVLDLAAQRGWHEQVLLLSTHMADSLRVLRYLDDMLTVMEAALAAARRAGNTPAEGITLNNLGEAYREQRRFEDAISCYRQALAIVQESGDRHTEGKAFNDLGGAFQELGRFEEAIPYYQQALAIARETGDRYIESRALNNLGGSFREVKQSEDAVTSYQQALAIYREIGDRYGEGICLTNLGNAYRELHRFESAIPLHAESAATCREIGDRYGEAGALSNLGEVYRVPLE